MKKKYTVTITRRCDYIETRDVEVEAESEEAALAEAEEREGDGEFDLDDWDRGDDEIIDRVYEIKGEED